MQKLPPSPNFKNVYFYFHATEVMYHLAETDADAWEKWNRSMRDLLVETQDQGQSPDRSHQAGSWSPAGDAWGGQFGRLGHTSLSLLTLQVYYRSLPLQRKDMAEMKKPADDDK